MITLSHRLPMLAGAVAGSGSWRDPEFLHMAEEKAQAAGQAALVMGGILAAGQRAIAGYAAAQAKANLALMTCMPAKPADVAAFGSSSVAGLAKLAGCLGEIGSQSVAMSLRPAHRKVSANAKRLAGQKRDAAKG
ncbi:MAG: hypothetical protein ACR2P3_08765 [Geminicoccaceae bacterium]